MEEEIECPNCIGSGEEYNKRYNKAVACKLCNGDGKVNDIIYSAYINGSIPSLDY